MRSRSCDLVARSCLAFSSVWTILLCFSCWRARPLAYLISFAVYLSTCLRALASACEPHEDQLQLAD